MSALFQQITQHPASVDAYIRNGWSLVPIPAGTKGPKTTGWNIKSNALKSQSELAPGMGIGLAHAYSGTMAFDIDEWDTAAHALILSGVNLPELYDAPDAVVIDSGRQGHGKLLYAMPFGMALPSKKVSINGVVSYELRCATSNGLTVQDILPPSIHPVTNQPYRWAGRGNWLRLPTIPDALLALWQGMLEKEKNPIVSTGGAISTSWEEIKSALEVIPPDCSRDEWVSVGMALQWAGAQTGETDQALTLWNDWSFQSITKYPGASEVITQWQSFKADKATGVKLGTLFHIAKVHGWVKPEPDITGLFAGVEAPKTPTAIFADMRPSPPSMDINLWPNVLAKRAAAIGEAVGCDPLVPLFAGMGAICAAMDSRSRLELLPGFSVPPVLWLMTIGAPADKKTPGSAPMFTTLRQIEDEDRARFARAALEWEGKEAAYASQKKAFLEFAASAEYLVSPEDRPEVPPLEPQPVPLRFTVADVTSQKLVRMAADRPQGLLCNLDEMNSWVKKLVDKSSGEDRSTWVTAYESRGYEMDRVGSGTIYAENMAISIYGNIQPKVFREHITALTADGLLQRFVPCVLNGDLRHKPRRVPEGQMMGAEWDQMIRLIYSLPSMRYTLSPSAYAAYDAFQDWYEERLQEERLLQTDDTFMTAYGKLEGLCGRFILLFHVQEAPFNSVVQVGTVDRVISLMKSYITPILRYTLCELANTNTFDTWMQEYIIHHCDRATLTLAEIKRSCRHKFDKMNVWQQDQAVMSAMWPMEQSRWVIRMDDGSEENKHVAMWAVNPALIDGFKDYRVSVIKAKQKRMDEVYKQSTKERPRIKGADLLDD